VLDPELRGFTEFLAQRKDTIAVANDLDFVANMNPSSRPASGSLLIAARSLMLRSLRRNRLSSESLRLISSVSNSPLASSTLRSMSSGRGRIDSDGPGMDGKVSAMRSPEAGRNAMFSSCGCGRSCDCCWVFAAADSAGTIDSFGSLTSSNATATSGRNSPTANQDNPRGLNARGLSPESL
jgi:hypothetical protein